MSGARPKQQNRPEKRKRSLSDEISPEGCERRDKDGLRIGGQNVESLLARGRNKMAAVREIILEHQLDILVLGETWLPLSWTPAELEGMLQLQIPGQGRYIPVRSDRVYHRANTPQGRRGGGLLVYIHERVRFTVTSLWECRESNAQFIEVSITEPVKFDLIAIYSPPRDTARSRTVRFLNALFNRNKVSGRKLMFVGCLHIDPHRPTDERFVNEFKRNNPQCRCLIDDPTHKPRPTRRNHQPRWSYVDHIATDIPDEHIIEARVIPTHERLSAHELVFCKIDKMWKGVDYETETKSYCQLKRLKAERLFELLPDVIRASDKCVLTVFVELDENTVEFLNNDEEENQEKLAELEARIEMTQNPVRCTLVIILDRVQSVNLSLDSLSHRVGGRDCFVMKSLPGDLQCIKRDFLSEYYICNVTNCSLLFNEQKELLDHRESVHKISSVIRTMQP